MQKWTRQIFPQCVLKFNNSAKYISDSSNLSAQFPIQIQWCTDKNSTCRLKFKHTVLFKTADLTNRQYGNREKWFHFMKINISQEFLDVYSHVAKGVIRFSAKFLWPVKIKINPCFYFANCGRRIVGVGGRLPIPRVPFSR